MNEIDKKRMRKKCICETMVYEYTPHPTIVQNTSKKNLPNPAE